MHQNQNFNMTLIKSFAKGYLARTKIQAYRSMVCKMRFLQRFYRRRHQMKNKLAMKVQKFMKGLKAFRRYQRLGKVKQGTIDILK